MQADHMFDEITILKTIFVVHYFHGQIQTWSCLEEEGDLLSNKNILRCYRFKTKQNKTKKKYKLIQINHINVWLLYSILQLSLLF
jgi:hypothetical protein